MFRAISAVIFFTFLQMIPTLGWATSDAEAINLAGRQRMLSQQMMKNHLLLAANIKTDKAEKQLDSAIAAFEEQFLVLQEYTPSKDIKGKLEKVESLWLPHRQKLVATHDRQALPKLLKENLALLSACDELVKAIEKKTGTKSAKVINTSGRQRMLSQKIAKIYVAMYLKVESDSLKQEFNEAIALFDQSQTELEQYTGNTQALNIALQQVRNQWNFSRSGFSLENKGRYVPTVIAVTTDSILSKMEHITLLYQEHMTQQTNIESKVGVR